MRKTIMIVLLALVAMAPFAAAQTPRYGTQQQNGYYDSNGVWHSNDEQSGYYDRNGVWHPASNTQGGYYDRNGVWHQANTAQNGYYDRNGVWHPTDAQSGYYDSNGVWHSANTQSGYYDRNGTWHPADTTQSGYYDRNGTWHPADTRQNGYYDRNGTWHPADATQNGYYDRNGQWHPNETARGGYYDRNGQWHAYNNDSYNHAVGPDRWTWSDNRGRTDSLSVAATNLASTVARIDRESLRRSGFNDRAALDALQRLDERARNLAQLTRQRNNRSDLIGQAYVDVVDAFLAARDRFGALSPDANLANRFHVMASALGRLDKRFFGNRAFGGQNPDDMRYGYSNYRNEQQRYDQYGNPLPRDPRARDTRPYPY